MIFQRKRRCGIKIAVIYRDKAGNTLSEDLDRRLAVRNAQGKIIKPSDTRNFLARKEVRKAMSEYYGGTMRTKILTPSETKRLIWGEKLKVGLKTTMQSLQTSTGQIMSKVPKDEDILKGVMD